MATLVNSLVDAVTYLANGILATVYFVFERSPHLLSIAAALFVIFTFDRIAQREAVYAPKRYGRGAVPATPPRTAQVTTGVALCLWLLATWSYGPPVPVIGAVMWWVAVLALLIMPQQRWSLLVGVKVGLLTYSLAVIGFRLGLWYSARLSPAQLAAAFNGAANAAQVLVANTGTVITIGSWMLWVVLPLMYVGYLIQNWSAQPMSLVNPFASAREVITTIRTRRNRDGPIEVDSA